MFVSLFEWNIYIAAMIDDDHLRDISHDLTCANKWRFRFNSLLFENVFL